MPPNNTAINTPAGITPDENPPNYQRPLTPLSYLSSPVPDLAATLHTQAVEEADEANASFLRDSIESLERRSHVDTTRDPRRAPIQPTQQSQPPQALPTASSNRSSETHAPEGTEDVSRRERLQRVLARLNRLHQNESSSTTTTAYGNRTPSPPRQSLYDWAPATSRNDHGQQGRDLDAILAELRQDTPATHPELLRVLGQNSADASRESNSSRPPQSQRVPAEAEAPTTEENNRSQEQLSERRRRERERINLRSRAVMQRARQESSPSSTERMTRYLIERERSGMSEEEERARGTGWYRPGTHLSPQATIYNALAREQVASTVGRERQERVEAFRRAYLAENLPPPQRTSTPPVVPVPVRPSTPSFRGHSGGSAFAENALKYVSELRNCVCYEDSRTNAMDHGLATKESFGDKHDDFLMDLEQLDPLPFCSWLQPGVVFEGHQYSNTAGTVTHVVEQINPNYRNLHAASSDHPPGSTSLSHPLPLELNRDWTGLPSTRQTPPSSDNATSSSSLSNSSSSNVLARTLSTPTSRHTPPSSTDTSHDHWPVRVTIHTVDKENMIVQGTMEAYDVPQHPPSISIIYSGSTSHTMAKAGNKHHPITTYLEGEIVDLHTHSFLTPQPPRKATASTSSASNTIHNIASNANIPFPMTTAETDYKNWRKLPPFASLAPDPESFARLVLSTERMERVNREYIFMRWKERCFVHSKGEHYGCTMEERGSDQDRGHGLTISGFYYCSLRRADGVVEGLYYDPGSAPAQWLRLHGQNAGWGSWEFR
ncbi:hypothetical protein K431DRAFT_345665 [Polychaeton citri CBS 116435]|uniref:Vacuolar import and degradation protein-domain-containing protein n=1 Tax=Polychaeton citri CBS 116435 TaxID=1314669 RepID=A0A9P4QAZ0_9PEZI|nr:hypothetical protein K431DRAFT_345665 [Polychaeton citri CBS 116435]